jgi:hypothetical protein
MAGTPSLLRYTVDLPNFKNLAATMREPCASFSAWTIVSCAILEWSGAREDWRRVSHRAVVEWLLFYVLFLIYAFRTEVRDCTASRVALFAEIAARRSVAV